MLLCSAHHSLSRLMSKSLKESKSTPSLKLHISWLFSPLIINSAQVAHADGFLGHFCCRFFGQLGFFRHFSVILLNCIEIPSIILFVLVIFTENLNKKLLYLPVKVIFPVQFFVKLLYFFSCNSFICFARSCPVMPLSFWGHPLFAPLHHRTLH